MNWPWLLVVPALLAAPHQASAQSAATPNLGAQQQIDVRALLNRYEAGEHQAVSQILSTSLNFKSFRDQLERVAPAWINANGGSAADRRRLVAASMALEAAYVQPAQWIDARGLVEWACAMQRDAITTRRPPPPGYRAWQLASIAIIERAHDHVFLVGLPPGAPADLAWMLPRVRNHLAHAMEHLSDEPQLFLSYAVASEYASWGSDVARPVWLDAEQARANKSLPPNARMDAATAKSLLEEQDRYGFSLILVAAAKSATLWELVDIFQGRKPAPPAYARLAGDASIRGERSVRLGNTYLRLARPDLAEPVLRRALAETSEPYLTYLAHLFLARGLEAQGRARDAQAEYRLALQRAPRAQSATIPLAGSLFTTGNRDEGVALMAGATAQIPAPDPWRQYQSGSARNLPALIEHLRQELR